MQIRLEEGLNNTFCVFLSDVFGDEDCDTFRSRIGEPVREGYKIAVGLSQLKSISRQAFNCLHLLSGMLEQRQGSLVLFEVPDELTGRFEVGNFMLRKDKQEAVKYLTAV